MSSESDEDDFLSADEGEGQEAQSKTVKKSTKVTKTSHTEVSANKELKKNSKNEDFDNITKSSADEQESEKVSDISGICVEKLNIRLDKCKIDKNKEKNIIRTDVLSRNPIDKGKSNVPIVPSDFESSDKETHLKSSSTEVDNVLSEIAETEISPRENKDETVKNDKVTASIPTETEGHAQSKNKPTIKEAKIGLKKPREKLGERLGSKKIGARVTKPLVGISSDSFINQNVTAGETKSSTGDIKSTSEDTTIEAGTEEYNEETKDDESSLGWGSWGDWGLSSLATAATSISREVTRGVGTVLETVESSIGAPDPEELAKEMVEEKKKLEELEREHKVEESGETADVGSEQSYSFGFGTLGSLVSGVSGALENASNKVLLGGLDTLEKIGRKTMDIIQEGDPGLRRKRAFLKSNKQNLASVLREARERAIAEEELRRSASSDKKEKQMYMAIIWDNTEGPAHTEALSLVAKQCQSKIGDLMNEIPPVGLSKLQERVSHIKNRSCINEEDKTEDIASKLMEITRDVQLPVQFSKTITGWPSLQQFLSKLSIEICGHGNTDFADIQKDMYNEVAGYVAQVVGIFHKAAEVSLITSNLDSLQLAQQFQRLCGCISGGLEKFADDVCESISRSFPASDPEFNETITNIYLQMAEVNSYLEVALLDLNTIFMYTEVKGTHNEL